MFQEQIMLHLDAHELEAALPTLIDKIREFQKDLNADEQQVFDEIILSASKYTESNREAQTKGAKFGKPISATATINMKRQIIALPEELKRN